VKRVFTFVVLQQRHDQSGGEGIAHCGTVDRLDEWRMIGNLELAERRAVEPELADAGVGAADDDIWFSPAASTTITATPVGCATSRTSSAMLAAWSRASASFANGSRPTQPAMRTWAPSRAAAEA
jgi:hypothetical protein